MKELLTKFLFPLLTPVFILSFTYKTCNWGDCGSGIQPIPQPTSGAVIMETSDQGVTWNVLGNISEASELHNATCLNTTGITIAAVGSNTSGFAVILKSTDYSTWVPVVSYTSTVTHFYDVKTYFVNNSGVAVGENGVIYKTANGGSNWTEIISPTTNTLYGLDYYKSYIGLQIIGLAVGNNGTIIRTVNGGASWTAVTSGITSTLRDVSVVNSDTILLDTAVAVGFDGTILRSTDSGISWMFQTVSSSVSLYGVSFSGEKDSRYGIAVGSSGSIYKSTDGGQTWVWKSSPTSNILYDVAVSATGNCVAVGRYVILRSTDFGNSWAKTYEDNYTCFYGLHFLDDTHAYGFSVGRKY